MSRTRTWSVLALALAAWAPVPTMRAADWHYVIGETRTEQQANFCADEEEIRFIARVFEEYGPRPGFAVLTSSRKCALRVQTFTPRAVVHTLVVETGKPNEYTLYFVEVETAGGVTEYLVTTRRVAGSN